MTVFEKRQAKKKEKQKAGKKKKLKAIKEDMDRIDSADATKERQQKLAKAMQNAQNLQELDSLVDSKKITKFEKRKLHKQKVVADAAKKRQEKKAKREQAFLEEHGVALPKNTKSKAKRAVDTPQPVASTLRKGDISDEHINTITTDTRFGEMFEDPEMALEQNHPKWKKTMGNLQKAQSKVRAVVIKKKRKQTEAQLLAKKAGNDTTSSQQPHNNDGAGNITTKLSKLNELSIKKAGIKRKWREEHTSNKAPKSQ
eukprot:TRINITY_DN18634_c0_g1_i1.p1 TRINITY_DN18634_c0_g1~~TRINITY_DN18634_c0_g1_i1.p1  ORF type:complete len:263 (-),score=60.74 TRINITY_DN18634_c0_g1_i1:75-842(-)